MPTEVAKSTGPVTPEGKRISSRNAAKHHLVARWTLLRMWGILQAILAVLALRTVADNSRALALQHRMAIFKNEPNFEPASPTDQASKQTLAATTRAAALFKRSQFPIQ